MLVHLLAFSLYNVPNVSTNDDCQQNCTTTKQQILCDNCIPQNITETVEEVILTQLNAHCLLAHRYCNVSWENVEKLSIVSDHIVDNIADYAFICLYEITTLKLSLPYLKIINIHSFYGLINVKVLDFTECTRLQTSGLAAGFSLQSIVPNLSTLILSNMGTITVWRCGIVSEIHRHLSTLKHICT